MLVRSSQVSQLLHSTCVRAQDLGNESAASLHVPLSSFESIHGASSVSSSSSLKLPWSGTEIRDRFLVMFLSRSQLAVETDDRSAVNTNRQGGGRNLVGAELNAPTLSMDNSPYAAVMRLLLSRVLGVQQAILNTILGLGITP